MDLLKSYIKCFCFFFLIGAVSEVNSQEITTSKTETRKIHYAPNGESFVLKMAPENLIEPCTVPIRVLG